MNYILFDGDVRDDLLPFTFTRSVADLRIGILTIREKWEKYLGVTTTTLTEEYLSEKFPMVELDHNIFINAAFCPTQKLVETIEFLQPNQGVKIGDDILAFYSTLDQEEVDFDSYDWIYHEEDVLKISHTWDLFQKNDRAIREDFMLITEDRISQEIPTTVQVLGKENIFIEEGAVLNFCTLNATKGPIYIGKNAEIMEGSVIRGPFALGDHAQVKLATKIYGATTVGPHCRVGGEVSNSVLFAYSNKGHDGFLGNSVLGEWCNIGADSNNSNLKNNYGTVKLWNYPKGQMIDTQLQFCGLMMGDHSKCGINTMFNTGTVVGVCANVFGAGFPDNYIPNFTWGGITDKEKYLPEKAFETAKIVMSRRNEEFTDLEKDILLAVFDQTEEWL
ncbi:GlmU family protein [Capnocytophaga sp. ARDL2]|uniref:GlmU family protein n=1 Tax=Capnocytophaga sp. ARDL2 TaxID=3238809 RepID=UPI003555C146